jgi:hypothetical protein
LASEVPAGRTVYLALGKEVLLLELVLADDGAEARSRDKKGR